MSVLRLLLLTCVVAVIAATAPAAEPRRAGPSEERTAAPEWLSRDTEAVVREAGAVGVLVTARDGQRRARARAGVAELGTGRPVPWRSSVRIGSSTKAFTATVVLQLVGEGRLALEDSVERWLPGVVTGHGNDGRAISVRQLLQHTSGLPAAWPVPGGESAESFEEHRYDAMTFAEIVEAAMELPPSSAPGTRFTYSNTNYVLAAMIVEAVTGNSWAEEVTSRIIVPLELTRTLVPGHQPYLPEPHPHTYWKFAEGEPWFDTTVLNVSEMDGEGSLVSTPRDLERFLTALTRGELLGPEQLAAMRTTVPVPEYERWGLRYGLGLMWFPLSCGGGYWTHWGDTFGASTRGGVTEDGGRAVVVSTTGNADHLKVEAEEKALGPLTDHVLCRGLT
ncbi:serine hydrolase domain-containing protein [Streptomyces sp. 4N509B]|uniref:serine hydrolase domain-containing protein n=1 Tax=Streptomyces sp. 4N509B TaxID=3457413 RepID=UPI003FD351C4